MSVRIPRSSEMVVPLSARSAARMDLSASATRSAGQVGAQRSQRAFSSPQLSSP